LYDIIQLNKRNDPAACYPAGALYCYE